MAASSGPRVLKAGIIDGTGEFRRAPTRCASIDRLSRRFRMSIGYADHGYAQIKIYSSVKPRVGYRLLQIMPTRAGFASAVTCLPSCQRVNSSKVVLTKSSTLILSN